MEGPETRSLKQRMCLGVLEFKKKKKTRKKTRKKPQTKTNQEASSMGKKTQNGKF